MWLLELKEASEVDGVQSAAGAAWAGGEWVRRRRPSTKQAPCHVWGSVAIPSINLDLANVLARRTWLAGRPTKFRKPRYLGRRQEKLCGAVR